VNTYLDCLPCFLRQTLDAARSVTDDDRVHEQIVREVLRLAADLDLNRPPPAVAQRVHRRLRELVGVEDPYRAAKARFNQLALSMLPELRERVRRDPFPLAAASRAAIAANIIDLAVDSALDEDRAAEALRQSCAAKVHGDFAEFRRRVDEAEEILYLADNAGEIVIDRLLVEELGPDRVTVAVRGSPVINDATLDDAHAAGLLDVVRVVENGSDAPGTILDECSPEFRERFRRADLVVSKGQGNFESLSDVGANVFFLLKVKCPVVSAQLGLPIGTLALTHRGSPASG
jgi:uncharacterized protein with ATP-grasp and redox domains